MALFAAFSLKAQVAEHWVDDSGIEIFQETEIVHQGDYSAGIIVNTDVQASCDLINQVAIPVTAGESFTISFWGICSPGVLVRSRFYWEGAASSFSPTYLGPGNEQWEQFTYQDTVPAGASALKIGLRFYDITGFVPGEIQYVDDVIFESPNGNPLSVANGDLETWAIIKPEPSNYPSGFEGTQKGFSILTSWTDAAGEQEPDNYLILSSKEAITTIPQDGIYYPDDLFLMDGIGFANVVFGEEQFAFTHLEGLTNYYFKIFPYTNSGSNIDYKTDGTAPEFSLDIPDVIIIAEQNFDESWNDWEVVSISGEQQWNRDNNNGIQQTPCARISGKLWGTVYENQDWLISPAMDFTLFTDAFISFYTALGFATAEIQLTPKVSTDYAGNADPLSATWTELTPMLPDGAVNWAWTWSGEIDVSAYESDSVHFAFVYQCGDDEAATWQIDNILISGENLPTPEPDEYPGNFSAYTNNISIHLSWTDAAGLILPDGYLILGSHQDNITAPVDGTSYIEDDDFSDGTTARHILQGIEAAQYADLISGTSYYFKIFPYTNSDALIDYKTDGMPPSVQAIILMEVDTLFTDFNSNWGGWVPFGFLGEQAWSRNNTSGLENSPCALLGASQSIRDIDENWLISPSINLSENANKKAGFYNALENADTNLSFKISVDFDGVGMPKDFTWVDLSDRVNWSSGGFNWIYSGDLLLNEYAGHIIYLAFVNCSSENEAATWGIDDVNISEIPVLGEPSNYPTNFAVEAGQKQIMVYWQDAIGEIVPEGYLLQLSDADDFTLPQNGIPVADDLDFEDGKGSVNVLPDTSQYVFNNLADSTTYFVSIIPFTNFGPFIKYKTDPAPPKVSATTAPPDGIFDAAGSAGFNIYPNPGKGIFYFEAKKRIASVQVFNLSGKLIYEAKVSDSKGSLDLRNFEKGVYLAVFNINKEIRIKQEILIQ